MLPTVFVDQPLSWRQLAAVAEGAACVLSDSARRRVRAARVLVESILARGIPTDGVNTGIGTLSGVALEPAQLRLLSRNLLMSHAAGTGPLLDAAEVRAIIAAAVNHFAQGFSGVRIDVVERLLALLEHGWTPDVPAQGPGYLAAVGLALIGENTLRRADVRRSAAAVLEGLGLEPLVLDAKEGASLAGDAPCAAGLAALALLRAERLLNWADVVAAMTFENLHGPRSVFAADALSAQVAPAAAAVSERMLSLLEGSDASAPDRGRCADDLPGLRAIPQIHGAARDGFAHTAAIVDAELRAVIDMPAVTGVEETPCTQPGAAALGAALGMSADAFSCALAELAALAASRVEHLVQQPAGSGLPAHLASDGGTGSGFRMVRHIARLLAAENRRLALPSSLDGGGAVAALKLLRILDNVESILGIELLAATQAYDLQGGDRSRAPNTDIVHHAVRQQIPHYRDDRPLARDLERARAFIRQPSALDFETTTDSATDGDPAPKAAARPRARRRSKSTVPRNAADRP